MLHRFRAYINLNNVILAVALLLAMSWLWGTMEALQKNFTLQQKVNQMQGEVELLDLETQMLQFQQKYLQSNEYLDLAAREHLGKVAPGEKVIFLPPNTVNDSQYREVSTAKTRIETPSNFSQWMTFFFGEKGKTSQ